MPDWDYGEAYTRCPIDKGIAVFENGSQLQTHDIFNPIPEFMLQADLVFVDPPWTKGNLSSFYTKAGIMPPFIDYNEFYQRLFNCIRQINPKTCYLEIGKEHLADFILNMRGLFKNVTFYNSSYYHRTTNYCYIVRGSSTRPRAKLDGMDEEDIIEWICKNETYSCIGDLCMGRGLVAINAFKSKKPFVGTEMNHKRLSVALESLKNLGAKYELK